MFARVEVPKLKYGTWRKKGDCWKVESGSEDLARRLEKEGKVSLHARDPRARSRSKRKGPPGQEKVKAAESPKKSKD